VPVHVELTVLWGTDRKHMHTERDLEEIYSCTFYAIKNDLKALKRNKGPE